MKKAKYIIVAFLFISAIAVSAAISTLRSNILTTAYKYKGTPYVYGAESPKAFDCSGFTRYVYREAYGVELPRSARGQYNGGQVIALSEIKPGDLMFYDTVGGAPSHVSIFIGDGDVIHAVSDGKITGVQVTKRGNSYWTPRIIGARRYIKSDDEKPEKKPIEITPPVKEVIPPAKEEPAKEITPPVKEEAPSNQDEVIKEEKPKLSPDDNKTTNTLISSNDVYQKEAAEVGKFDNVVDIAVSIPRSIKKITDSIPTEVGTKIAFMIKNDTGADGNFVVKFFYYRPNSSKVNEIHQEKILLENGKAMDIPAYEFSTPGKYKLIVQKNGKPLCERVFMVRN